ncbi:MAG: type II toxin-antitoxin system RelE/ParE family toxin [Lewinellaceae bacterium]|nr:type II toxin-antitoxin system RelE/ParE family toxin [Lewinellaceae bacterium]
MALRVIWTKNSQEHLESILSYWEQRNRSKTYPKKLYKLFQNGINVLTRYPETGSKTSNLQLRKKSIKEYFVYYSFDEINLIVLGIVDMRRNPKFLKKFEE